MSLKSFYPMTKAEGKTPWIINPDAERGLLGGLMLQRMGMAYPDGSETVKSAHRALGMLAKSRMPVSELFFSPAHRDIFDCISHLMQRGELPSHEDVIALLQQRGQLEEVGGRDYIWPYMDGFVFVGASTHICAELVVEAALSRRTMKAHGEMAEDLKGGSVAEVLGRYAAAFEEMRATTISGPTSVGDSGLLDEILAEIFEREQQARSIPYYLRDVQEVLGGMVGKELVIFSAWSRGGKTTLANNIALRASEWLYRLNQVGVVVYISLEEPRERILFGMTSILARVDSSEWRKTPLDPEMGRLFGEYYAKFLQHLPLHILHRPGSTVDQIFAEAENIGRESPVRLVLVDYMQRISLGTGRQSREEGLTSVANRMADWTHKGKCPGSPCLIVFAQEDTGRDLSNREIKAQQKTMRTKARFSQGIFEAADQYLVIDRPDLMEPDKYGEDDVVDLIFRQGKGRQTRSGNPKAKLHKPYGIIFDERERPAGL